MISLLEYAKLSGKVYYDIGSKLYFGYRFAKINANKKNKHVYRNTWSIVLNLAPQSIYKNAFYAALFIKFQQNKATDAVVAFRGTKVSFSTLKNLTSFLWSYGVGRRTEP